MLSSSTDPRGQITRPITGEDLAALYSLESATAKAGRAPGEDPRQKNSTAASNATQPERRKPARAGSQELTGRALELAKSAAKPAATFAARKRPTTNNPREEKTPPPNPEIKRNRSRSTSQTNTKGAPKMAQVLDTPKEIAQFVFRSNLMSLELEIYGIKTTRGRSAYVQMKEIHKVKGSRRKVYNLLRDKYIRLYPDARAPKELE